MSREPGLELEKLVLEKVFGFPAKKVFQFYEGSNYQYFIPSGKPRRTHEIDAKPVLWFSRDMNAAWQVVEHLTRKDRTPGEADLYFKLTYAWDDDYGCWAYFDWKGTSDSHPLYGAQAPTAPHAICLAALKVAGVES